jgi:hypothetical protein
MPGAIEASHMGHPDFRVGKKVFATLGYPDAAFAMVEGQRCGAAAMPHARLAPSGSEKAARSARSRIEVGRRSLPLPELS